MLNIVFEVVSRYIFSFGGDIDKFIGDAFLALFSDLKKAVTAMYGIQKELVDLNREQQEQGKDVIRFRIGMHTGLIIRGNVGGNDRYDNTLIGDAVNTAARLESKAPHGGLVISESIRKQLDLEIPDEYRLHSELKGRKGEETYYSVFDYFDANPHLVPYSEELESVRRAKKSAE